MKRKKNNSNDIIEYILTIITIVNILVVTKILGLAGIGYFAVALTFVYVLTAFSSGWTSNFLAKYIKGRSARKQYRNASNFFRAAMLTVGLLNLLLAILLFTFGNILGNRLLKDVHIGYCICIAAPILFLYAVSAVFCGYFKGFGMHRPVMIYQIIRQIITFSGSIYFMKLAMNYGIKVSALLQNENITFIYGAFGAIIGFVAGHVFGMITLLVFWILFHGELSRLANADSTKYSESIFDCIRIIFISGLLGGFKNVLFLSAPMLNYILYVLFKKSSGADTGLVFGGCLFGIAIPCMILMIAIFMILSHKGYRGMTNLIRNEDYAQVKNRHYNMLLGICSFGIFSCVGFAVLTPILTDFLTPSITEAQSTLILSVVACAILVIAEIVQIRLHTLMNHKAFVYLCAFAGFVLQAIAFIIGYKVLKMGNNSILLGVAINAIVINLLCAFRINRKIRFNSAYIRRLIMAGIVAFAGALLILLTYQLLKEVLSGIILFVICLLPGFIVYVLGMVFLQIIDYDEAEQVPFGSVILQAARLLHRE